MGFLKPITSGQVQPIGKSCKRRRSELAECLNITPSLKTAICIRLSFYFCQPPLLPLPLVLGMLIALEYSFNPIFWYHICTFINNLIIRLFLNYLNWKLPSVSFWDSVYYNFISAYLYMYIHVCIQLHKYGKYRKIYIMWLKWDTGVGMKGII